MALAFPVALLLGVRYVVTSSVPKGLWYVHSGIAARGQYVLACLPYAIAAEGKRAGYLPSGNCPNRTMQVMKRIVGIAGDRVVVGTTGVSVNGALIANSRRLEHDSRGRSIPGIIEPREYRVPRGDVWLMGDWYKSWDSRYYGPVPAALVIGVGVPLLVEPAGS